MKEKVIHNRTLCELILGILLFGILIQILMIIFGCCNIKFADRALYYSFGLWIGIVLAVIYAMHMNYTITKALNYDSETAVKLVRKGSLIRYGLITIVLGFAMMIDVVSPLTIILGVFGVKIGAYLNSLCHKIITAFVGEEVLPPIIEHLDEENEKNEKKQDEKTKESIN